MPYDDFEEEILDSVAALTGTVRANTPDPGHPGKYLPQTLWDAVESARINVVEYAKAAIKGGAGNPLPPPPYVAVLIGETVPSRGFGASERPERAPVTVAILGLDSLGHTKRAMRDAMRAVKEAWDAPGALYDTFQAVEQGRVDASAGNPVFRALGGDSNVRIVAATLAYSPGPLLIEAPGDEDP